MNVLKDNRNREGYWRVRIDGRLKTFQAASRAEAEVEAQRLYDAAQEYREGAWLKIINKYITYVERTDAKRVAGPKWKQSKLHLRRFANRMDEVVDPRYVKTTHIQEWWDSLTRHQQDPIKPWFDKLMNWGIMSDHFAFRVNPGLHLTKKAMPPKKRQRLTVKGYNQIMNEALDRGYRGLALAMQISYATTLRRGDVLDLMFDDIVDNGLNVVVGKSMKQRGAYDAARLRWDFNDHPHILELVKQCNMLSIENGNCPYLISHPRRHNQHTVTYNHHLPMNKKLLTEQFTECSKAVYPGVDNYPTFHEVRSLAGVMLEVQGIDIDDIRTVMAHTDAKTTAMYLSGHERSFMSVKASNG